MPVKKHRTPARYKARRFRNHPLFLGILLAGASSTLLISNARAANECQIQLFHSPSNSLEQPISLSIGDQNILNSKNTTLVKNDGRQPVVLHYQGRPPVTLAPGETNPPRGRGSPTTLSSVECLSAQSINAANPQQFAILAKRQGKSPLDTTRALKTRYRLNLSQATSVLAQSRFSAADTALALQSIYRAPVSEIAKALKKEGVSAADIIAVSRQQLRASSQTSASLGKSLFNGSASQVAIWLQHAGYPLAQIPAAMESIESNPEKIVQAIKTAYKPNAEQLVAALKRNNVIINMKRCGISGCTHSALLLKKVGYPLGQSLKALKTHFNLSIQASFEICKSVYRADNSTTRQALQFSGFSQQDINNTLPQL